MPLKMHSTVPESVRALASSQEQLTKLTSGRPEIGIRLVSTSYPEMRDVWARVSEHPDKLTPTFFFEYVVSLPAQWDRTPKTASKPLQKIIADVATTADTLAVLLDTHRREIDFHRGPKLTFNHVMVRAKTIRSELAGQRGPPSPFLYTGSAASDPSLPDFLHALAAELRPPRPSSASVIRPTKVADKNADRTFMAKSLADVMKKVFGDYCFDVVAVAVNTILDEKDDLLDAKYTELIVLGPPKLRKIVRRN